jgi:hypothetical protein
MLRGSTTRQRLACAAAFLVVTSARVLPRDAEPPREDHPDVSVEYSKDADRTEVSLSLAPAAPDGSRPPFRLVFSSGYTGKSVRRPPAHVQIAVQPHPLAIVRGLSVRFMLDGSTTIDLTSAGRSYRYTYPCDECAATGVVTQATLDEIRRIAGARRVDAEVLGFDVRISPAEQHAMQAFIARLTPEPERPTPPRIVPPVMEGETPGVSATPRR